VKYRKISLAREGLTETLSVMRGPRLHSRGRLKWYAGHGAVALGRRRPISQPRSGTGQFETFAVLKFPRHSGRSNGSVAVTARAKRRVGNNTSADERAAQAGCPFVGMTRVFLTYFAPSPEFER
jgi:hypothetical protein